MPYIIERLGGEKEFQRHCWKIRDDDAGLEGWWVSPGQAYEFEPSMYMDCDIAMLYLHGGGFVMGSPAFYLEVIYRLTLELQSRGWQKPAIFLPVYPLAPDARFPKQIEAATKAWGYTAKTVRATTLLGISGDSAGGCLAISAMLKFAELGHRKPDFGVYVHFLVMRFGRSGLTKANLARLISPWTSLIYPVMPRNSTFDFVSPLALQHFAHLYSQAQHCPRNPGVWAYFKYLATSEYSQEDSEEVILRHRDLCRKQPLLSPLELEDDDLWFRAMPRLGVQISYGTDEVLALQSRKLIEKWKRICGEDKVRTREWQFCHAPAMVYLYLGEDEGERRQGVQDLADFIGDVSGR